MKDSKKRDPLSDNDIVNIFNLMYWFRIGYLDARACLRDGISEKLIQLLAQRLEDENRRRNATTDKGPVEDPTS